jgi:hypothetical protein
LDYAVAAIAPQYREKGRVAVERITAALPTAKLRFAMLDEISVYAMVLI